MTSISSTQVAFLAAMTSILLSACSQTTVQGPSTRPTQTTGETSPVHEATAATTSHRSKSPARPSESDVTAPTDPANSYQPQWRPPNEAPGARAATDNPDPDSEPRASTVLARSPERCPAPTTVVDSDATLREALDLAHPGDSIHLKPGTYTGPLVIKGSGVADKPIWICGPRQDSANSQGRATISSAKTPGKYVVHVQGARHLQIHDLTAAHGLKGIVLDQAKYVTLLRLRVRNTGHEAVHFRSNSRHNTLADSDLADTGNKVARYGEGVYIGSAVSNWCKYTKCKPDRSDHNVVRNTTISRVSAEAIDIKEGVSHTLVSHNTFRVLSPRDGARRPRPHAANSAMDVKGNDNDIVSNLVLAAPHHGFQVRPRIDAPDGPWGLRNFFHNNQIKGPVPSTDGRAFDTRPDIATVVTCFNDPGQLGLGVSDCHDSEYRP